MPGQVMVTGAEVGTDARLTVYRLSQEALTNIPEHAWASRMEIRLAYEPHKTRLIIEDFGGCGQRPAPDEGTGHGLTGMSERAELPGGTLTAGPTGSGFRVDLQVPA